MNPTKIKEVLDLTKQGISTFYYIGQMARYRYQYSLEKEPQSDRSIQVNTSELAHNKDKMIKYTILSGIGMLSLFAMGIAGLVENRKNNSLFFDD